jgi:hypothetical protein
MIRGLKTRPALVAAVALLAAGVAIAAAPPAVGPGRVTLYKDPACGCCRKWAARLAADGFVIDTVNVPTPDALDVIRRDHGITRALASCHTAVVSGYVFEGHVPITLVERVLREHPPIAGLAVPGMPSSAEGMDMPTGEHYDVLAVHRDGTTAVYASR